MGKTKFIAALFVLLIPVIAGAATPKMISFQGKLTDSSNNALNGSYDFIFTIYDNATAGTAQWTETQTGITVTNGLYSVDLGAVNAITSSFDAPYWLDVQVRPTGGGTYEPLSPRHRLTSSPYAFMSDYALNVSSANNYWLQLTSGGATNLHTHASGTPTAHAATHAAGAGDAVTISTSQIVNGSITSTKIANVNASVFNLNLSTFTLGYLSATRVHGGQYFGDGSQLSGIVATVADGSITTAKLAANAVNGEKISPTVIASTHMAGNNNDSIVYDIKVTTAMSVRDEGIVPAKMANSDSHFNLNLTTFTFKHANVLGILNSANANIGLLEGSSGHAKLEVVGTGDHMIINNPAAGANKTLWLIKSTGDYLEFVAPNDGWTTWPAA